MSEHKHYLAGENVWVRRVMPGEFCLAQPGELLTTVLGSCVAVCITDPVANVHGMNHFLLPQPSDHSLNGINARYGDWAMEALINALIKQGAHRNRLVYKAFGGAKMWQGESDIGGSNIGFLKQWLNLENSQLASSDLGGQQGRLVRLWGESGRVQMKRLAKAEHVVQEERAYQQQLLAQDSGDVELF
ncbi:chemotaxis protein CheD [Salinibius halmophilus]|uniref:chemotaxis protein CheD n=1 Tax=Salinibius halmophilus TaxID=1853216 RepID=UPI000E67184F|nr:chemotaxis protein CheD [Salinibius halmophilus]